ncbi:hypothetical protein FIV07_28045 (plasmid) [Mycobacterium sp. THAF192]|nr:hypothetical protein FIV07_28045 [Mycobacterium sp. THAF192]
MATAASPGSGISTTTRNFGRSLVWGAGGGVIASLVMAMFAMIAGATYLNSGFFTPLYHIASTFIAPDAMMQSMQAAMAGQLFTFLPGPALAGAIIHMMVGAMYGAVFGLIAAWTRLHGATLVAAATAWGLVVFAVSAWIALPVAAALFGGGDPIQNMAAMVGYPTFILEHLMFGAALGLVLLKPTAR